MFDRSGQRDGLGIGGWGEIGGACVRTGHVGELHRAVVADQQQTHAGLLAGIATQGFNDDQRGLPARIGRRYGNVALIDTAQSIDRGRSRAEPTACGGYDRAGRGDEMSVIIAQLQIGTDGDRYPHRLLL